MSLKSGPLSLIDIERDHAKKVFAHLTRRGDSQTERLQSAARTLGIDLDHLTYILELPAANDDE